MRRNAFPRPDITRQQAMGQLRLLLAGATDEKLAALTVDRILATHRVDRREVEVLLLAAQETRRREIARRAA